MSTTQSTPTQRARLPRRVLWGALAVLLLWLAIGGVGGQRVGSLSQLQKNDNASFLPASAESTKVAADVSRLTKGAALPLIVVIEGKGQLTAEQLTAVRGFAASLPGTAAGTATVGHYLTSQQAIPVPSKDKQAALIVLPLDQEKIATRDGSESPLQTIADALRNGIDQKLTPAGLTAHITGPAGFVADLVTAFGGIDGILLVVALAVVLVILLVVYRSPVLPFAVLLTAVFGLAAAGFVVYEVADRGWITLSGQSQGILSILVVGAATDYALLLVSRYKEELHDRASTWEALRVAWRASVEPIMASAFTVILGLLALLLADLKGTAGLGPVGALGILGALVAALTFLPVLLVLGRRWIFWPAIPRVDHRHSGDLLSTKLGWGKVARAVGERPKRTWLLTTIALVAAAAFLPTLRANGISQSDLFLTKVDSVTGQQVLAKHFDAGSGSPIQIVAPQAKAQQVVALLSREQGVSSPYIGVAPGVPPVVVDGMVLVQATLTAPADDPAAIATVERLRSDLDAVGTDVLVGGQTAQALDTKSAADRDLKVVAPAIMAVVFVVLALLLRSLVAALMLMVVNVLSFAATMGISALVFNHVFRFADGDPTTVLYGFVFLVALGVDYSIFLMSRAREESAERGTRQGVLTALAVTGGVITSAGIVLAATFGALAVVPLLFLAQIAFIVAFGVLLDTLVVRSLWVPSATILLGRRTWWPSRMSRDAG